MVTRNVVLVVDDHAELAELLASALVSSGFEVVTSHGGADALKEVRRGGLRAAIVDLLLPDVLGVEVLDALAACSPPIPSIAISGVFQGGPEEKNALTKHGASQFFAKPFATAKLVEAVHDLLDTGGPAEEPSALDAEVERVEEELLDGVEGQIEDVEPLLLDASMIVEPAGVGTTTPEAIALRRRMGFVEELIPVPKVAAPKTVPEPARKKPGSLEQGDLSATSVPRLLAAFHQARTTGSLILRRGKAIKIFYLEEGVPVYAASNLAGDRLLTYAVNLGVITQEDARAAYRLAKEGKRRVGELLIDLDLINADALGEMMLSQVRGVIWSTFPWKEGRFRVRTGKEKDARKPPLKLDLPLGPLILDGVARTVPLLQLRQEVPDDLRLSPRQAPPIPLEEIGVSASAARILVSADGTRTVAQLVEGSDQDERAVRALLYGLMALDVLGPHEQTARASDRVGFVL